MKKIFLMIGLAASFVACEQAKEADVDLDGAPDVFVKGKTLKDADKQDNIFVMDGLVVNGVTNEQWTVEKGVLQPVETPTFKMEYDAVNKKWNKIPLS